MTSSSTSPPVVDNRNFDDIMHEIRDLAISYLSNRWIYSGSANISRSYDFNLNTVFTSASDRVLSKDVGKLQDDVGIALSTIFVSFYLDIISRLNKLPTKNFIEFLNILGFNLSSPIASRVPVTFKLVDGANEDIFVPKGTVVAANANDKHDELIYETEGNMKVTRTNLSQVYTVNKKTDVIQSHIENLIKRDDFILFHNRNENLQQHILYLGHKDLFNLSNSAAKIFLTIVASEEKDTLGSLLSDGKKIVWEYNWKLDDKGREIKNSASKFEFVGHPSDNRDSQIDDAFRGTTIILSNRNNVEKKIEKSKINGIENHWIRCRFQPSNDLLNLSNSEFSAISSLFEITARVELDTEPESGESTGLVGPDMLFYKDVPIPVVRSVNYDQVAGDEKSKKRKGNRKEDIINKFDSSSGSENHSAQGEPKFIYPFGKLPVTFDTFYIASNDCFSKKKTIITLRFLGIGPDFKGNEESSSDKDKSQDIISWPAISSGQPGGRSDEPIISWEYWNGKGWNGLSTTDRLNPDKKYEELNFLCPDDVETFSVEGNSNYWIRARLISGDYGKARLIQKRTRTLLSRKESEDAGGGKMVEEDEGVFEWDYNVIKAPKFERLGIKFSDYDSFKAAENQSFLPTPALDPEVLNIASRPMCVTYNNLQYDLITDSNNTITEPARVFKQFVDDGTKLPKNNIGILSHLSSSSSSLSSRLSPSHYIYLGFDKKIDGGPILIYFSLAEKSDLEVNHSDIGVEEEQNFYYYSPAGWKRLYAEDGTNSFTKRGYLKFFFSSDFQAHPLFGDNLYWIRIEDTANFFLHNASRLPQVHNILLNTVSCVNAHKIEDELLLRDSDSSSSPSSPIPPSSSSNGLRFIFAKRPMTLIDDDKGEQVWVKENLTPSNKEWNILSQNNRLRVTIDAEGNPLETWVLWSEFKYEDSIIDRTRYLSKSSELSISRVYSIDRVEGTLTLGNVSRHPIAGSAGTPLDDTEAVLAFTNQIGSEPLVRSSYGVGGGTLGNVRINEVKILKSFIPLVDSVKNFEEGEGGSDVQSIKNAMETLPSLIKSRGQAVTIEDFESLIMNRFASLSRAKCFPTTDGRGNFKPGHVLVVIIPQKEDSSSSIPDRSSISNTSSKDNPSIHTELFVTEQVPYPSTELVRNVRKYLYKIASENVISSERLHVTGPSYFRVYISANLFVSKMDDLPVAQRKALELIKKFLDPVDGGGDGKGWEFGKVLGVSEIYGLLSGVPEVIHIDSVAIKIVVDIVSHTHHERKNDDNNKSNREFIISETKSDPIEIIYSSLLPHSLLCDGNAHSLNMMVSEYR